MNTTYSKAFYEKQAEGSLRSARVMLPLVFEVVRPSSVIDIGCGVGAWLEVAAELGAEEVFGVDGHYVRRDLLRIAQSSFLPFDLATPLTLGKRFDLAICLEVAEHIPASASATLIENLVRHAPVVLFSAAIPGQGGTNHVNEQWPEYWSDIFSTYGYACLDCLRHRVWSDRRIQSCYRQNMFLFVEASLLASHDLLRRELNHAKPIAWVHPEVFLQVATRPVGLRRLVKEAPLCIFRSLKARLFKT